MKNIYWYWITEEDKKFLSSFNEERIQRVHEKIELAKKKARTLTGGLSSTSVDGWEFHATDCPICRSKGVLTGTTELSGVQTAPDDFDPQLDFSADGFECDECGLKLDDFQELRLAGMETNYDRSEQLDKWFRETEGDYF